MNDHRSWQNAVAEFHRAVAAPVAGEPAMLTPERSAFRSRLIEEEASEFRAASESGDWLEMVDALADILYVTYGTAVEMGVDLYPFFAEVHRANLQKAPHPAGGKSIKPEGWTPPDLERVYRERYGHRPVPSRDEGEAAALPANRS